MSTREAAPATVTATVTAEPAAAVAESAPMYHLHLQPRPRITFNADVVDNEHLGRKKSNSKLRLCCLWRGYYGVSAWMLTLY